MVSKLGGRRVGSELSENSHRFYKNGRFMRTGVSLYCVLLYLF